MPVLTVPWLRSLAQRGGRTGRPGPREPRTQAQGASQAAGKVQRQVARARRPPARIEGLLHHLRQLGPGRIVLQLEGRRPTQTLHHQQAPRRRVGGAHARASVDDQHAVHHLLDHQAVELRLLTRQLEAAARGQLFARKAAG